MSYSKSMKITSDKYRKFVPEFLRLLSKYSYSQAKIETVIKLKTKNEEIAVIFKSLSKRNPFKIR